MDQASVPSPPPKPPKRSSLSCGVFVGPAQPPSEVGDHGNVDPGLSYSGESDHVHTLAAVNEALAAATAAAAEGMVDEGRSRDRVADPFAQTPTATRTAPRRSTASMLRSLSLSGIGLSRSVEPVTFGKSPNGDDGEDVVEFVADPDLGGGRSEHQGDERGGAMHREQGEQSSSGGAADGVTVSHSPDDRPASWHGTSAVRVSHDPLLRGVVIIEFDKREEASDVLHRMLLVPRDGIHIGAVLSGFIVSSRHLTDRPPLPPLPPPHPLVTPPLPLPESTRVIDKADRGGDGVEDDGDAAPGLHSRHSDPSRRLRREHLAETSDGVTDDDAMDPAGNPSSSNAMSFDLITLIAPGSPLISLNGQSVSVATALLPPPSPD